VKLVLMIAAIVSGLWILAFLGIAIIVAFLPEHQDNARRESDSQHEN